MPVVNIYLSLQLAMFLTSIASMELFAWLTALFGLYTCVRHKDRIKYFPKHLLLILFFCALSYLLNYIFTPHDSFKLTFSQYLKESRWIVIYLGYFFFFLHFKNSINLEKVLLYASPIFYLTLIYALVQTNFGIDPFRSNAIFHGVHGSQLLRPNGFFNYPNTFAYCISLFGLMYFPILKKSTHNPKSMSTYLYKLFFILWVTVILLSFTRAVWIGCFFCLFLYLLSRVGLKGLFCISGATLIFGAILYFLLPPFRLRIDSFFDPNFDGNIHRLYLWRAYYNMFTDHLFFGTGLEVNYSKIDWYLQRINAPDKILRSHPHNSYLNLLSGLGLVGFFSMVSFYLSHLYTMISQIRVSKSTNSKILSQSTLYIICVFLIGGLFECTFKDSEVFNQCLFWLSICSSYVVATQEKTEPLNQLYFAD